MGLDFEKKEHRSAAMPILGGLMNKPEILKETKIKSSQPPQFSQLSPSGTMQDLNI